MNTIGKILVVCNVLMALATAGFLVVDFATRTNWKKAYDEIKREQVVREGSKETSKESNKKLDDKNRGLTTALDKARAERTDEAAALNAKLSDKDVQLEEAKLKITGVELEKSRLGEDIARLKEEVNGLLVTLAKREKTIVALEEDSKKYLASDTAQRQQTILMQERNQQLLERIRQMTANLADMQNKGGAEATSIPRDPDQPNPPATFVKGKIEKIDTKDRSLVQLSVGTDHGVNKNHTLEVYRTAPRAEYLGTVRIIDSFPHKSVGKLMRSTLPRSPLQEGDIAASTLSNP